MGGCSSALVIMKKCNKNPKYITTQCLSELWRRRFKARECGYILFTLSHCEGVNLNVLQAGPLNQICHHLLHCR